MLRAPARQSVISAIENSYFGTDNYSVEFLQDGKILFIVKFIPNGSFVFQSMAKSNSSTFPTLEIPGIEYMKAQMYLSSEFSDVVDRLHEWLERVKEEMISVNPFAREISELRDQIDKKLSSMEGELEGFFSSDEAKNMYDRLAEFEAKLSALAKTEEALSAAVEKLKGVVADLQSALSSVNRGTWFRMSGGRLLAWLKAVSTSKEGREFALEAAKQILLEGPK